MLSRLEVMVSLLKTYIAEALKPVTLKSLERAASMGNHYESEKSGDLKQVSAELCFDAKKFSWLPKTKSYMYTLETHWEEKRVCKAMSSNCVAAGYTTRLSELRNAISVKSESVTGKRALRNCQKAKETNSSVKYSPV